MKRNDTQLRHIMHINQVFITLSSFLRKDHNIFDSFLFKFCFECHKYSSEKSKRPG